MTKLASVPAGDPATLRSVAGQLGGLATAHAGQRTSFHNHVTAALTGWTGPLAEQYAYAAGQTSIRFTAVCNQLKAAEAALYTYAQALDSAQQSISAINGKLGNGTPDASTVRSLNGQADTDMSSCNQAAKRCAGSLYSAEGALSVACPDILTPQQLLAVAKKAWSKITSPSGLTAVNFTVSAYALYADAAHGVGGAKAAQALKESQALVELLGEDKLSPQVANLLAHLKNPSPLTVAWEKIQANALEERDAAQAATDLKGGSFLAGLVKANQIDIAEAGAHAADQGAIDVFLRTSKLGIVLAPVTIALGIYSIIDPGSGPTWERDGNRVAGGLSVLGGAGQLLIWSISAFSLDWEIPGLDVVTAVALIGAALWCFGDIIYDERHNIAAWYDEARHDVAHWYDDARHDVAHYFDDARHDVAHFGDDVVHDLNPLNW